MQSGTCLVDLEGTQVLSGRKLTYLQTMECKGLIGLFHFLKDDDKELSAWGWLSLPRHHAAENKISFSNIYITVLDPLSFTADTKRLKLSFAMFKDTACKDLTFAHPLFTASCSRMNYCSIKLILFFMVSFMEDH